VRQILPTKNKFKQKQNKQIERKNERKKNEILIDKKEKAQRT
jgi:hypothetical protein